MKIESIENIKKAINELGNGDGSWYVLQVWGGKEEKVSTELDNKEISEGHLECYVPSTMVISSSGNILKKPSMQGYMFVKMKMTDDNWWVVRNTEGVLGIIGSSGSRTKPTPASDEEMKLNFNKTIEELTKIEEMRKLKKIKNEK